jgi:hypothetical protein
MSTRLVRYGRRPQIDPSKDSPWKSPDQADFDDEDDDREQVPAHELLLTILKRFPEV